MHHPWRRFRDMVDWRLIWGDLPDGQIGETDFDSGTVTLSHGLTQAQRRCTIAHETEHAVRGPVPEHLVAREERDVDRNVARLLLPDVRLVGEALAWAHSLDEAADELWVDVDTLRARLASLHPAERAYLKVRLGQEDRHDD